MALWWPYQLSDSCLHSAVGAKQIGDGPFNFWGWVGFCKYLFYHTDVEARACVRACERACVRACVRLSTRLHLVSQRAVKQSFN